MPQELSVRRKYMPKNPASVNDVSHPPRNQAPEHARCSIQLAHCTCRIREQRKRQAVLRPELPMRIASIRTDPDHLSPVRLKLRNMVPKPAGLHRAARRVVLRVEENHHGAPPAKLAQPDRLSILVGKFKIGRQLTRQKFAHPE